MGLGAVGVSVDRLGVLLGEEVTEGLVGCRNGRVAVDK